MIKLADVFKCIDAKLSLLSRDKLLDLAIQHVFSFVSANFAGIRDDDGECFKIEFPNIAREFALEQLSFGLNRPFPRARLIEHLWLAKRALLDNSDLQNCDSDHRFVHLLWQFRILKIWSAILAEREIQLKTQMDAILISLDKLRKEEEAIGPQSRLHIEFLLEKFHFHVHFFEHFAARDALNEAQMLSGIVKIDLGSALGRRTQFQHKSLPQLLLNIKLSAVHENGSSPTEARLDDCQAMPHNCKSGDDTLLEETAFDDLNAGGRQTLTVEQSACVLANALLDKLTNPMAKQLNYETTLVFLEEVIRQRQCWALQLRALIERSMLEKDNSRRVERACAQLEALAHMLDGDLADSDLKGERDQRVDMLLCSSPLPFWEVSKLHANVLFSLGCVSEALRIFESLELWEEVVKCYQCLRQPEKAECLVRKLIEQREDPVHLCILGDITDNAAYYQRAIEISNDKSARAQSSLGQFMLRRKRYDKAVEHLSRSVAIQPLQLGVWFNIGFAAMQIREFKIAVRACHRCVSIEPEHFEAWNNLAASYIHLGQKERAQKMLLEAVKLNWENHHVWENLLLTSVDIGDLKQAIASLEKLLDLDQKRPLDELPLQAVATELLSSDKADEGLVHSLAAVFSRVNARQSLSPKLLRLYAELRRPTGEKSADLTTCSFYAQLLERAFQREYDKLAPPLDPVQCSKMLSDLQQLVSALKQVWTIKQFRPEQVKMQLKLRIGSTINLLEREFGSCCENSENDRLVDLHKQIKELFS